MSSSLDDHVRSVLDRARVTLSGQLEAELAASTGDLLRAVADEQQKALLDAKERTAAEVRLEAEQQLSVLRAEFELETADLKREKEDLERGASSEIAGLERTLDEIRDELEVTRHNLQDARGARERIERELDQSRRDGETSTCQLQEALDRAGRDAEEIRLQADSSAQEIERLRARLAQSARLTSALRTLDEATSLGDILEHLAQSARQETGRTAVFLVNGDKLRGWRALGFEAGGPIVGSDFAPAESGVVGQAVRMGIGQQHRNGDDTLLPSFAADNGPRDALALPVQVGGSVIAVLYCDAARTDRPEDPEWLDTIDAMTKHAGRVLEAMTVRRAAALWTPRPAARRS